MVDSISSDWYFCHAEMHHESRVLQDAVIAIHPWSANEFSTGTNVQDSSVVLVRHDNVIPCTSFFHTVIEAR
jgi:hypothetical protein